MSHAKRVRLLAVVVFVIVILNVLFLWLMSVVYTPALEETIDGRPVSSWAEDLASPDFVTSKQSERVFVKWLENKDDGHRAYAAGILWRSQYIDSVAIDALIDSLFDSSADVREPACRSLEHHMLFRASRSKIVRMEVIKSLVRGLYQYRDRPSFKRLKNLFSLMIENQPEAVSEFIELLQADGHSDQQRQILYAIKVIGPRAKIHLPILEEYANSGDQTVAEAAKAAKVAVLGHDRPD